MTDKTDSKEREAFVEWMIADVLRSATKPVSDGMRDALHQTASQVWDSGEEMVVRGWKARASLAASAGSEPVAWRAQFDAWWSHNRMGTHQVKNIGGFAAKVWHAAIKTVVGATDSTAGFYPADEGSTPSRQATPPSPPEGMVAEQALRKVLSVVQRYLPPDGPTAHDAMTEITAIVDPWPLGPLEKL